MPITSNTKRLQLESEITRLRDKVKQLTAQRDDSRDAAKRARGFLRTPRTKVALRLRGDGIEIGALHKPLTLPDGATAKYVDFRTREDNIRQYPHLDPGAIVETHYVCDGESLDAVATDSVDFVIANHMLEHCINPIRTVENFLRVTRDGGFLFISLPDKRHSFDHQRPVTPFSHILSDYRNDIQTEPLATYQEWCELVDPSMNAERMHRKQTNIHFHVWTYLEMVEMFHRMQSDLGFPLSIVETAVDGVDVTLLLKKEKFHADPRPIDDTRGH